ncbi:MAG: long-chain fatty acid--CoA ligase, partial [Gemmatimonadota bacterium]
MSADLAAIGAALEVLFAMPFDATLDDATFNALARRVFAFQFENNAPYAAWCRRRGRTPDTVDHWTDVPAVPTAAFKEVALVAGDANAAEAVFRTSGTTSGVERRGTHHVLDLSLYHRSLRTAFRAMVLPDGATPVMFSLVPSPGDWPESSLAHMIGTLIAHDGAPGSGSYASAAGGLDSDGLAAALADATRRGVPVCLLGTSFSYVHWLDALAAAGRAFRLPEGSRLMDTGGFKGRSREVSEDAMRAAYEERLGVSPDHAINEYGMTEMASQFYDTTLRETVSTGRAGPRRKRVPPWVRTRIVDPDSLEPVPAGRPGLLQHFDLANAGSVMAI